MGAIFSPSALNLPFPYDGHIESKNHSLHLCIKRTQNVNFVPHFIPKKAIFYCFY